MRAPPTSNGWGQARLHEIKQDGFRVIARKDGTRVRLLSRPGNDFTDRFPLIVEALAWLRSRSCIIDGEAVCCDDKGVPSFDRIRYHRHDGSVFLYAFDLIELNGDDLRREPLEVRKVTLASVLAKTAPGLRLNEHIEADGPTVFAHACKMGLEGIVSDPWRPRLDGRRKAQLKGLARHAGYCSSDVRAEASTSTDAYLNVGRFVEWLEIGKIEIPLSGRRLPKRRGRKEASPFARV